MPVGLARAGVSPGGRTRGLTVWLTASPLRAACVLTAIALAARLLFLVPLIERFPKPWQNEFQAAEMGNLAVNLYEGRGFSSPFSHGAQPSAWLAPFTPALWAGLMKLTHGASPRTARIIVLLQAVPSALAVGVCWLAAAILAQRQQWRRGWLLIVGLALALWPESFVRLPDIWYYPWQELGIAVLVYLGLRWEDAPSVRNGLWLGVAAGATALVNPVPILIFFVALGLPFFRKRDQYFSLTYATAVALMVAAVLVAPWLVRNYRVFGHFVPIRSDFGVELLQGNNDSGAVKQQITSLHPALDALEFQEYQTLGEIEYERRCFRRAVAYMIAHPGVTATRTLERFYVAWCTDLTSAWPWTPGAQWWRVNAFERLTNVSTILCALLPLMLFVYGLWWVRTDVRGAELVLAVLLLVPLPYYLTQVDDAYMQPVRVWLFILAASLVARRIRIAAE